MFILPKEEKGRNHDHITENNYTWHAAAGYEEPVSCVCVWKTTVRPM
jgi:hypothetical protein